MAPAPVAPPVDWTPDVVNDELLSPEAAEYLMPNSKYTLGSLLDNAIPLVSKNRRRKGGREKGTVALRPCPVCDQARSLGIGGQVLCFCYHPSHDFGRFNRENNGSGFETNFGFARCCLLQFGIMETLSFLLKNAPKPCAEEYPETTLPEHVEECLQLQAADNGGGQALSCEARTCFHQTENGGYHQHGAKVKL